MLNTSYDKLEDIPQEKRGAYIPKDGKFVLDTLEESHPLVVKKNQLKTEVSTKQGQLTKATNENTELKSKTIPEGHVVVAVADKQLLDTVKSYGGTPAEIDTKLKEHATLKAKDDERTKQDHLRAVARVMGWKEDALLLVPGLPDLEIRDVTENGQPVKDQSGEVKKQVIAKLKGENNTITEKQLREHFDATPALKIFEPSLLQNGQQQFGGTEFPRLGAGGGNGTKQSAASSVLTSRYGHVADKQPGGQQQ